MICRDCHDVIEDYLKLIEKYSQLVIKDNQSSVDKESAPGFKNEDSALSSEKQLPPLERTDNNSSYDTAPQPSITLPNEQVQSLRDLLGEYKKKKH